MKNNSTPGIDGFTIEFYKAFIELAPQLVQLFNYVIQMEVIPSSWNQAKIVLIPKLDKDPMMVESYRPISLLNMDYKYLAAVLGAKLNQVIGLVIHYDQIGFVKVCQMKGNIRKVINIIDLAKKKKYCNVVSSRKLRKLLIN